jgi:hypothetical protein
MLLKLLVIRVEMQRLERLKRRNEKPDLTATGGDRAGTVAPPSCDTTKPKVASADPVALGIVMPRRIGSDPDALVELVSDA